MTRTPGKLAYEAFAAAMTAKHASWGMPTFEDLRPAPDYQDAWEAAAQAVLALDTQDDTACPVCGAHDRASRPVGLEVHRDMTCEDCGATWVNVYNFTGTRDVQPQEHPHA